MTLGIKFSQITPLYPHRVFLQWDLIDPTESGSYTFTFYRSGSMNGPWEVLKAGAQNTYNYIDDLRVQPEYPSDGKVHLFSLQKQIYYKIKAIPPSGCVNQAETEPTGLGRVSISPIQEGLRRKLRYEELIMWKRFNGVRLAVLKRKMWGTHCTTCYDATTRAITKDNCTECYGTSFAGGYWDPVVTFGRVYPPQNTQAQLTERGRSESLQGLITLLDTPILQDEDLIIETDTNNRHIIRKQTQTELRRKSVHQQVVTSLLERDDVAYQIPVDFRTIPPIM